MRKTRFAQEISGDLGDYWVQSAKEELKELREDLNAGRITIDENGIAYNKIGRVVMPDLLEKLTYITDKVDVEATKAARDREVSQSIAEYKESMKNHIYSAEELYEMRSAFGAGTTVVNVLTGQQITL